MSIFKQLKDYVLKKEGNEYKPYNVIIKKSNCKGDLHQKECNCLCHNSGRSIMHIKACCHQETCDVCNQIVKVIS